MSRVCVWIHDNVIHPNQSAIQENPDGIALFVFDERSLKSEPWSLNRLRFVYQSVCDLFQHIPQSVKEMHRGDMVPTIMAVCREHGCETIAVMDHPDPSVRAIIQQLEKQFQVIVYPHEPLAEYTDEPVRFSRYWNKSAKAVLGYIPKKRF